jgi:hypothetical protein
LEATKTELQSAIRSLEISGEEQKAINEEALSINEEYQSANEELLTSKEELQSLNEELTALNGQLQETLERQRTTSDDLQNVLYSTDVATLFLDTGLNIRFFTPATKMLFNVIPGDVGRPIADLHSLAADSTLATDAQAVLQTRPSSSGRSRRKAASGSRAGYCPIAPMTTVWKVWSSLYRCHRAQADRGRAGSRQAGGRTGQSRKITFSGGGES